LAQTADVVIGGGVTGTSLAYHLADRAVKNVVVLEKKFLAAGGTGHSVGIIRQLYPTREASQMVLRSLHDQPRAIPIRSVRRQSHPDWQFRQLLSGALDFLTWARTGV